MIFHGELSNDSNDEINDDSIDYFMEERIFNDEFQIYFSDD